MYILITAAATAKAHQLKNILSNASVLLGDYHELPEIMVRSGRMLKLPDPKLDSYPHLMLALCLDKQIAAVHILNKEEYDALNNTIPLFNEYDITITAAYD